MCWERNELEMCVCLGMSVMPNATKRYKLILKILAISPKNQLASVRIEVKMFMAFDITIILRFNYLEVYFLKLPIF